MSLLLLPLALQLSPAAATVSKTVDLLAHLASGVGLCDIRTPPFCRSPRLFHQVPLSRPLVISISASILYFIFSFVFDPVLTFDYLLVPKVKPNCFATPSCVQSLAALAPFPSSGEADSNLLEGFSAQTALTRRHHITTRNVRVQEPTGRPTRLCDSWSRVTTG